MKKKLYFYADFNCLDFIKKTLFEFDIQNLSNDIINSANIKNTNALFFISKNETKFFNSSFFLNNKTTIFFSNNSNSHNQISSITKIYYGPVHVKIFLDIIKESFLFKGLKFKDVEITIDSIRCVNSGLEQNLTALELKFLSELAQNKVVERSYFLENVLGLKKNIQTKSIESHLTRIRKKLSNIKSKIKISSKEDNFYLDY
jgi:hypothetical protein